jgi:hypothetical protein
METLTKLSEEVPKMKEKMERLRVNYNTVMTMVDGNLLKMQKAFKSLEKQPLRAMSIHSISILSNRNNEALSLLKTEIIKLNFEVDLEMKLA